MGRTTRRSAGTADLLAVILLLASGGRNRTSVPTTAPQPVPRIPVLGQTTLCRID